MARQAPISLDGAITSDGPSAANPEHLSKARNQRIRSEGETPEISLTPSADHCRQSPRKSAEQQTPQSVDDDGEVFFCEVFISDTAQDKAGDAGEDRQGSSSVKFLGP
jgi:hypothetical protein